MFPSLQNFGQERPRPLVLAACYLPPGIGDEAVEAKGLVFESLMEFLSSYHDGSPWVIAGCFNMPTSSYTLDEAKRTGHIKSPTCRYLRGFSTLLKKYELKDLWTTSRISAGDSSRDVASQVSLYRRHEGEEGATFDPASNVLASKTACAGSFGRPQRYDRILVNDKMALRPYRCNHFGLGDGRALISQSGHWGVRGLLKCQTQAAHVPHSLSAPQELAYPRLPEVPEYFSQIYHDGTGQRILILEHHVELLRAALGCQGVQHIMVQDPMFVLHPVGSFGLGTWDPSSDVDCLCLGNVSSATFFALAMPRLRNAGAINGITGLRRVKTSSGTMLEVDIKDVRFNLRYCCARPVLERHQDIVHRPTSDPVFASLPVPTLIKLALLRDMWYLQRSIPDMAQFCHAHLLIRLWAQERGLYSSIFGYLGDSQITIMLVVVCKLLADSYGQVGLKEIIFTFFNHYANFDFRKEVVYDPFFHKSLAYHRTSREAICILGWHAPSLNCAADSNDSAANVVIREIREANIQMLSDSFTWASLLPPPSGELSQTQRVAVAPALKAFMNSHKSFIRIDMRHWGSSAIAGCRFMEWLESRLVTLLADLDKRIHGIHARIWPQRLIESDRDDEEVHVCYFVGLTLASNHQASRISQKASIDAIQSILESFERRIHHDVAHFSSSTSWLAARLRKQSALVGSAIPSGLAFKDLRDAPWYEEDSDHNDETGEDEEEHSPYASCCNESNAAGAFLGKLRPAIDVLNRLRWDPSLDGNDHVVGYEDRFDGACEKTLGQWKSDYTDEEFIPQHRILYFRRLSDGAIVWERRTRLDTIFR
ncbi:uncharacterized protein F5Z01DRAFT_251728 [Emericellopsis atlantica]|uniref:polynucleotide adenylyltransferase n=1 Tax=Emericellopsis atlantica TaxID=2614577 RepID=A0A9P7ZHI9_9HYPO|nr:uncharacterized protein F5Z01DRAFT_251728 [Emericellopsis atlantica]KAG9251807.1 hypothetical protein F5Z01DRAFT_251728 [Emericellopsis atlantica]